jgi:Alginate lyase
MKFPRHRKMFVIPLLVLGCIGCAVAGPVTIKPGEIAPLRELVRKDADAAQQYADLKRMADDALRSAPNPIEHVISEGTRESDPRKIATRRSMEDMGKVEALAWVWVVSEEERYARKGREYILAWARTNQPDGNAINESAFEPMIEAYDLLRDGFSASERALVDGWLRKTADLLWKDTRGLKGNWYSHRLKTVGLIALTLHDDATWAMVDKAFKQHLEANFDAQGESLDFRLRDALHYHIYALRPLLTLACASERNGVDLYDYKAPNGASLPRALDFLRPFALSGKKHIEFANSTASFDKTRAKAGEAEYKPHPWSPRSARVLYADAGCLDPSYNQLAAQVAREPGKKYLNWRSVLNVAAPAHMPR